MIKVLLLAATLLLTGCGGMEQRTSVGDNSVAEVSSTQDRAGGAKVDADAVDDIVTNYTDGIPIYWFLIGCLVLGMIIPQPRLVRWIF